MNHRAATGPPQAESTRWASLVIHASAGTGKTFHLSNRFLQLLLAGQSADRILATTFTRKAAGEILQRVVYRLAAAAASDEECRLLGTHLAWNELTRDDCRDTLVRLTRQLHRVRIATLDSFFLQVARGLSLELGLPPRWQIVDEHEDLQIRSQAIANLLQQEDSRTVLQLMHWLTQGEAGRRVHELLSETVAAAYEIYLEAPSSAWEALNRRPELDAAGLTEAIERVRGLTPPKHKKIQEAFAKDLQRAEAGDWPALLESGIGSRLISGETRYYGVELSADFSEAYAPLMDHARACLINRLVTRNQGTFQLLDHFHQHYCALQRQRQAMRFGDLARWLTQLEDSDHLEHVPFRLDAAVESLLLDEFQDTALVQWQVIRPFAFHAAAATSRRSFLCVGDVKQAIYGWRGGDADLLAAVARELPHAQPEALDESFRSAPQVIDAVNAIHQGLARHPNLGDCAAAIAQWSREFPPHSTRRTELSGWVTLETSAAADEEERQADLTLQAAADRVQHLISLDAESSLAVLVRTNASVGRMINLLRSQGIPASEEGGNPLTDSAAVGLVLSLLQLADHPGDTIALYHVARSPWGKMWGLSDDPEASVVAQLTRQIREQLADAGYGKTLSAWAAQLRPFCDAREWRRLNQLVELAVIHQTRLDAPRQAGHARQIRVVPRIKTFLRWVEQQKVSDPSTDRVRVMTIHQSKGLQFDRVVLPDLDRRVPARTPHCVVHRPGATDSIDVVCRYANDKLRLLLPKRLQDVFARYANAQIRDELCVLYVALTRAIRSLHMIIAPSNPKEKNLPRSAAGWIRAAVTDQQPLDPAKLCQEWGQPPVATAASPIRRPASKPPRRGAPPITRRPESPPAERLPADAAGRRGWEITAPSALEGHGHVRLGQCLSATAHRAMAHGVLIHAFFEQIEWLEDGTPDEDQLTRLGRRLDADPHHLEVAIREFHAALTRPHVSQLLSRANYESWLKPDRKTAGPLRLEVRREQPLSVRVDDTILSGSIDRLVLLWEADQPRAAEIIDVKTDQVTTPQQRIEREEHYAPQIQAYARGLSRMLQLDPERITTRLLFLSE